MLFLLFRTQNSCVTLQFCLLHHKQLHLQLCKNAQTFRQSKFCQVGRINYFFLLYAKEINLLPNILLLLMAVVQLVSLTTLELCSVRIVAMDSTKMKQTSIIVTPAQMMRPLMAKLQPKAQLNVPQVSLMTQLQITQQKCRCKVSNQ